jgi:hypothetical protein
VRRGLSLGGIIRANSMRVGGVSVQSARPAFVAAMLGRCAGCEARRPEAEAAPPGGAVGAPAQGVRGWSCSWLCARRLWLVARSPAIASEVSLPLGGHDV